MGTPLTVDHLARISENPDPVGYKLARDLRFLTPEMKSAGITTKKRIAAFLANVIQETDRLKTLEEYGDEAYFRSFLGGQWRYHGRGYLMNTWYDAYVRLGEELGEDLVDHLHVRGDELDPDKLERPQLAAKAAIWFWTEGNVTGQNMNRYADMGESGFDNVCSIINRGQVNPTGPINGWEDRKYFYQRALNVLPDDVVLGGDAPNEEEDVSTEIRRVVFPEVYTHRPTAERVAREVRNRVALPPDKTVELRDSGTGTRIAIPQRFVNLAVAQRVRDEIREKVDLPEGKTVVLHTPRPKNSQSRPEVPNPKPEPARPKTEKDRLLEDVEAFFKFAGEMLGAPYGSGWEEGTWPALSSLYSRITEHDPPSYYRNRECICSGLGNIGRFEVADLPSFGWDQGDGWPGGTAAIWRHYANAPGSRPYPPVKNTPRGWAVISPYLGAPLRLHGHISFARGDGRVFESRVPALTNNRTEAEVDRALKSGGARGNLRIAPPELWLRK